MPITSIGGNRPDFDRKNRIELWRVLPYDKEKSRYKRCIEVLYMTQNMNQEESWQAVLDRDQRFDGAFVYAVRSTGVYCRPSCPSRKPKRSNVKFFPLPEVAERMGYRPCKRCQPDQLISNEPQVELCREICRYIDVHVGNPLTLDMLGRQFGFSPSHLQRTFKSVVGITPREYQEAVRMDHVRDALSEGEEIASVVYEAGYKSSSRLYSKSNSHLGMTPGRFRDGGQGVRILFTTVACRLGTILVAATERGICRVEIGAEEGELVASLYKQFERADVDRDDAALGGWVAEILRHLEGEQPHLDLPLDVQATAFQRKVWRTLQEIPYGSTRTYQEIASAIGQSSAARAVAGACAANPTALLIPCHRVIRVDGGLGGYRWGVARKRALLDHESA